MRLTLAIAALFAVTVPAAAQQAFCPYGQTCQTGNPVPFPVVNPAQGLSNVLTYPLRQNMPPPPPPVYAAPIATPPPVMPPGTSP
jgi:hypothetical protein